MKEKASIKLIDGSFFSHLLLGHWSDTGRAVYLAVLETIAMTKASADVEFVT